jgi:predicted nucleic acid-binding protein
LHRYVIEPSSDILSLRWAEAMDSARRNGRPIAAADAWIAATALHLGVPPSTDPQKSERNQEFDK